MAAPTSGGASSGSRPWAAPTGCEARFMMTGGIGRMSVRVTAPGAGAC